MENEQENIAQTLSKEFAKQADTSVIDVSSAGGLDAPFVVSVPEGRRIEDLTAKIRDATAFLRPARRNGTARLKTLDGLVDWANRFKNEHSMLFVDPTRNGPKLSCVANYHQKGSGESTPVTGDFGAQHCDHIGVYDFPLSKEWLKWLAFCEEPHPKDELAEFIEDNAKDLSDPTPYLMGTASEGDPKKWEKRHKEFAEKIMGKFGPLWSLITMAREFTVHETSDLTLTRNRDTGETVMSFAEEHKDASGKPLKINNLFLITIPVFESGEMYRILLRFSYVKRGSTLTFRLTMQDPDSAIDDAINLAVENAVKRTDLPFLSGSPERI